MSLCGGFFWECCCCFSEWGGGGGGGGRGREGKGRWDKCAVRGQGRGCGERFFRSFFLSFFPPSGRWLVGALEKACFREKLASQRAPELQFFFVFQRALQHVPVLTFHLSPSAMSPRRLRRLLGLLLPSPDPERGRAYDYVLQGAFGSCDHREIGLRERGDKLIGGDSVRYVRRGGRRIESGLGVRKDRERDGNMMLGKGIWLRRNGK